VTVAYWMTTIITVLTRNSASTYKLRDMFRGQSRSPNMIQFHVRYGFQLVRYNNTVPKTMSLRYSTSENVVTFNSWSEVT